MDNLKQEFTLQFTPKVMEVAKLFCSMDEHEMALLFNAIGLNVKTWDRTFCFQMQDVTDSPLLNFDGRRIMSDIGLYSTLDSMSEVGKNITPEQRMNIRLAYKNS